MKCTYGSMLAILAAGCTGGTTESGRSLLENPDGGPPAVEETASDATAADEEPAIPPEDVTDCLSRLAECVSEDIIDKRTDKLPETTMSDCRAKIEEIAPEDCELAWDATERARALVSTILPSAIQAVRSHGQECVGQFEACFTNCTHIRNDFEEGFESEDESLCFDSPERSNCISWTSSLQECGGALPSSTYTACATMWESILSAVHQVPFRDLAFQCYASITCDAVLDTCATSCGPRPEEDDAAGWELCMGTCGTTSADPRCGDANAVADWLAAQ